MERYSHDTVSRVECLFNAISVMNIDVDVQYALVVSEGDLSKQWFGLQLETDRRSSSIPRTMSVDRDFSKAKSMSGIYKPLT